MKIINTVACKMKKARMLKTYSIQAVKYMGIPPDKISTTEEAVKDVEAIVLVTRWKEFEKLPQMLREAKTQPVVVDGRRMLDKDSIVNYAGIGR